MKCTSPSPLGTRIGTGERGEGGGEERKERKEQERCEVARKWRGKKDLHSSLKLKKEVSCLHSCFPLSK
jgi:hypothetical protein